MNIRLAHVFRIVATASALALAACSGGDSGSAATTSSPVTTSSTAAPTVLTCDRVSGLFLVSEVTSTPDSCETWVEQSQGRAVQGSTGSASVWSRDTTNGTALIIGAVHTLGQGWFGAEGTEIAEAIADPAEQVGIPRLYLRLPDGSGPDAMASPWFGLYNPSIAAVRNGNLMHDVLPREDFYVAVTDAQKLDTSGLPPTPEPIGGGPVPLFDPAELTVTQPTYGEARAGELVLMMGYANETGRLTGSVGRILDDAEASAAVATLADLGDPEGNIAYDAEAEVIIEGIAVAGMSGGPVIDSEGRLIAVLVRASDDHDGVRFARAVRMTYVTARLDAAYGALDDPGQLAVSGYLER